MWIGGSVEDLSLLQLFGWPMLIENNVDEQGHRRGQVYRRSTNAHPYAMIPVRLASILASDERIVSLLPENPLQRMRTCQTKMMHIVKNDFSRTHGKFVFAQNVPQLFEMVENNYTKISDLKFHIL